MKRKKNENETGRKAVFSLRTKKILEVVALHTCWLALDLQQGIDIAVAYAAFPKVLDWCRQFS